MTEGVADTLLHGDFVEHPKSKRTWAYPLVGMVFVSVFIAYHMVVLLTWNTPSKGIGKKFHSTLISKTYGRRYFSATSNTQSWSMFAPNPNRTNVFIRVLVTDADGQEWDMGHDIWQKDRHPYWFYDRMGKINRRIDGKKGYQRVYGAWMCREWAETHGGEIPEKVRFVKRWTRIPHPAKVLATGRWGYNPWELPDRQKEQETIRCKSVVNGQLSNEHRARHGLPPLEDDGFKPVKIRTWKDQQEAKARRDQFFDDQEQRTAAVKRGEYNGGSARETVGSARARKSPKVP
jgi:hypothetical protein